MALHLQAEIVAQNVCKHVEIQESAAKQEKALAGVLHVFENEREQPTTKPEEKHQ